MPCCDNRTWNSTKTRVKEACRKSNIWRQEDRWEERKNSARHLTAEGQFSLISNFCFLKSVLSLTPFSVCVCVCVCVYISVLVLAIVMLFPLEF